MWQRRQAIPDFPCCLKPKQKWSSSRAHSQWKRSSAVCVIVRLMHQWGAQHRTSNSDRLPTLKSLKLSPAKKLFWFSRSGTKLHCHLTESQTLTLLSWHLRSLWLKPHKRNIFVAWLNNALVYKKWCLPSVKWQVSGSAVFSCGGPIKGAWPRKVWVKSSSTQSLGGCGRENVRF